MTLRRMRRPRRQAFPGESSIAPAAGGCWGKKQRRAGYRRPRIIAPEYSTQTPARSMMGPSQALRSPHLGQQAGRQGRRHGRKSSGQRPRMGHRVCCNRMREPRRKPLERARRHGFVWPSGAAAGVLFSALREQLERHREEVDTRRKSHCLTQAHGATAARHRQGTRFMNLE